MSIPTARPGTAHTLCNRTSDNLSPSSSPTRERGSSISFPSSRTIPVAGLSDHLYLSCLRKRRSMSLKSLRKSGTSWKRTNTGQNAGGYTNRDVKGGGGGLYALVWPLYEKPLRRCWAALVLDVFLAMSLWRMYIKASCRLGGRSSWWWDLGDRLPY